MALGVDGVRVGTWTSAEAPTGCTVILPPEGALGALAVRGMAPGTREAAALGPSGKLTVCHGVLLTGSSAFGLAAADGVVAWLEEHGFGYDIGIARIPIVGAAVVLDMGVASKDRPGRDQGYAACEHASADDPREGATGVGRGCTVAKVGGLGYAWKGGQGVAVRRDGDVVVGALVANNAVGEVIADDGSRLAASRAPIGGPRFPSDPSALLQGLGDGGPTGNTVLGCVVTNARLSRSDAQRAADLAHSGIVRAVVPAHTSLDGDAMFLLATGEVSSDLDLVAHLAAEAVAEAARRGPLAAVGMDGLPGLADSQVAPV